MMHSTIARCAMTALVVACLLFHTGGATDRFDESHRDKHETLFDEYDKRLKDLEALVLNLVDENEQQQKLIERQRSNMKALGSQVQKSAGRTRRSARAVGFPRRQLSSSSCQADASQGIYVEGVCSCKEVLIDGREVSQRFDSLNDTVGTLGSDVGMMNDDLSSLNETLVTGFRNFIQRLDDVTDTMQRLTTAFNTTTNVEYNNSGTQLFTSSCDEDAACDNAGCDSSSCDNDCQSGCDDGCDRQTSSGEGSYYWTDCDDGCDFGCLTAGCDFDADCDYDDGCDQGCDA